MIKINPGDLFVTGIKAGVLVGVDVMVGEGVVRTLVKRLKKENLVNVSHDGMRLTLKGRNLMSNIELMMNYSKLPKTMMTLGSMNYAVLVKNAAKFIGHNYLSSKDFNKALTYYQKSLEYSVYDEYKYELYYWIATCQLMIKDYEKD